MGEKCVELKNKTDKSGGISQGPSRALQGCPQWMCILKEKWGFSVTCPLAWWFSKRCLHPRAVLQQVRGCLQTWAHSNVCKIHPKLLFSLKLWLGRGGGRGATGAAAVADVAVLPPRAGRRTAGAVVALAGWLTSLWLGAGRNRKILCSGRAGPSRDPGETLQPLSHNAAPKPSCRSPFIFSGE